MKSNSGDHDQSLSETAQLLGVEVTQDGLNSSADGSNAILLPGKKKGKSKDKGKASKKNVNKQVPVLGKSKQRKLKKLEEEKQNKLLQARSIKILEKCKVWDGAYSLLHSSGTIGQAETMKEKRRRAVQLSKAGIDVPEDILPFKNKNNQDVSEENEGTGMPDHHQSHQEKDCCDNSVLPTKKTERDDGRHSKSVGVHSITSSKVQVVVDVGTDVVPRTTVVTSKGISTCNLEDQKHSPFILSSSDKGHETNSKDKGADGSKIINQNMKVPPDLMVQKHVNAPIVVHVSRPVEVEEKRKDLPIIMMEQEIMEAINENSIVILCGETGCGKTTQVPQFLYEAGFGSSNRSDRKGIIGVTQPRRVAVLATAKRVSFELGLHLGKEVGFQVRHDKMIGDNCSIKFMTDGILLREVQSDFLLKRYSVIILDEAHERSLNTDILIGMLSRIIKLRQKLYAEQQEKILSGVKISPENFITKLKLVLMSATLRVEDFISNKKLFHEIPPVLEVPVRQFPVTVHFSKRTQQDYLGQAYKKVMSIHKRLPPGGILVFVTGQREVEFLCKKLQRASEQLNKKNSKKADNEITASSDVDMKEINEAFGMGSNSLDQQTDRFNFYEEDENNPDADCDLSDAESESELEVDSEDEDSVKYEAQENTGMVLDFLNDVESLSSLKASFEALAGNLSNQDCKEKPSLPDAPSLENGMEVAANSAGALYVLPLYAMLPASAQLRIFEEVPEGDRLVVVATNVAETSLTIPGIKYVVDTGKEKVKNYNYTNGMATFEVQWISKASAAQRAGRAGRTGPGHCYRLYSSAAFSKDDIFPDFSCPEISKIPVDGVVLLMKFMGIDKVANFPFPTPPETKALVEAELCLKALEALDSQGRLTPMGSAMAQYPMSPHHSRMLLTVIQIMRNQQGYARANFVLGYAVAAASALSFQNPFLMQFGENHGDNDDMDQEKSDTEKMKDQQERLRQKKAKAMAREARARLCNPSSDALTIAYALQLFELAENSVQFCKENSLHLKTMDEMSKLRKQLLQLIFYQSKFCEEFAWNHGTADDVELSWRIRSDRHPLLMNEEELLGQSLCAGWADRIAKRVRTVSESSENDGKVRAVRYQSCALKDTVYLHRWSSVSRSAPEFLVYTELLHTKRPYMHGVTSVKSDWLVKYASSLCTFSAPLTDPKPYYEPLSDQVFCWVSPTFGRHNWQLPLHSLRIKNDILRVSVFACALLEGQVLPCLRSIQKFLAAPPSSLLKPQALGQRRVGDLLSRLKTGSRTIDSRAKLRDAWSQDPLFLHSEIKYWFQERFHDRFGDIWEEMHHEVHLESCELFPKRAKKEKKKVK